MKVVGLSSKTIDIPNVLAQTVVLMHDTSAYKHARARTNTHYRLYTPPTPPPPHTHIPTHTHPHTPTHIHTYGHTKTRTHND